MCGERKGGAAEGRGVADIDGEVETGVSERGTLKLGFEFGERGKEQKRTPNPSFCEDDGTDFLMTDSHYSTGVNLRELPRLEVQRAELGSNPAAALEGRWRRPLLSRMLPPPSQEWCLPGSHSAQVLR